jgi:RNA polymerase subunit RPABC4/transcription elongation factor Spt4
MNDAFKWCWECQKCKRSVSDNPCPHCDHDFNDDEEE